jgi:hypothetical protein
MKESTPGRARRRRRSAATVAAAALVLGMVLVGPATAATAASVLPDGFHAESMSWVTPKQGFLLGSGTCGQSTCTTVLATTNGGGRWHSVGTIDASMTFEEATGVTELRFADPQNGWAFEPGLQVTADGGATWQPETIPGGGHLVLGLAADADAAYLLSSPCQLNRLCHQPVTLWRTTPGSGVWTQVALTLPVFFGFDTASLAVEGSVAYVAIPTIDSPDPDILDVTLDGQTWTSMPDPCSKPDNEYLISVAPISGTKVGLLCKSDIGFGQAEKRAFRSMDAGQTTVAAGQLPLYGITSQLAAAPNGTLLAAESSIGSWIYRNAKARTWTTPEDLGDGGMGWNDPVFTTGAIGFVIHGPFGICCGGGPGEVWRTTDGGATWAPI